MTVGERIRTVRKDAGLTLRAMGNRIAITNGALSQIETGRANPSDQTIRMISREFGVREDWLRTGTGPMYTPSPADELDALLDAYSLPRFLRGLFERYAKLPEEARRELEHMIEEWAAELTSQRFTPEYDEQEDGATEYGDSWQDDISPRCKTCPMRDTCQKRHGQSGYEDAYFQQGPQMYPGWSAHLNMPGDFPDVRMPRSFANTAKCPLSQRRFQKPVVSVDAKNVHDFTPEEAHAALDEELERRKREKAALPDSGSGNSGEDAG